MPLVTIDVRCGRPPSELDAVADTVDEAMVEYVEVPGATAATETLAGEEDCPRSSFFATGVRIQIRAKGFLCGSSEFDDQDKLPTPVACARGSGDRPGSEPDELPRVR